MNESYQVEGKQISATKNAWKKKIIMVIVAILVLVVLVSIIFGNCNSKTPAEIAIEYFDACNKGEFEIAANLCEPELAEARRLIDFSDWTPKDQYEIYDHSTITKGKKAKVILSLNNLANGQKMKSIVYLVKIRGKWMISREQW